MDMYAEFRPTLEVTVEGPLRILTMNRPDELNSLDDALHVGMQRVWARLQEDEGAGAVVLTGAGRGFSAGGDMHTFVRAAAEPAFRRHALRTAERLALAMIGCELPMVAAVNGPAIGLGASLAVLCDLVVMADDTYLCDPHVSVGLVAGDGGAVSWPLLVGLLRAKEFLLLGDRIPAAHCLELGLANRVVPRPEVLPTAIALAERLAAQPRQALLDTKRALNIHLRHAADLVLPFALAAEGESFASPDVREIAERFTSKAT